jgi:Zn-dependent M28 family amino/carboxypeptidase
MAVAQRIFVTDTVTPAPTPAAAVVFGAIGLAACGAGDGDAGAAGEGLGASITAREITTHTAQLASDEFLGRAPGTRGETLTLDYLVGEFERLGLEPGTGDGFVQEVPMIEITPDFDMTLEIGGESLAFGEDFVAWTRRLEPRVELEASELVFAGYGVVAPEHDWNDYEGVDWAGKTAVVLVNDPGFATGDPALFDGRSMTYYGRWTYKYEEAARQGAAGVLIVHDDAPAGYGWNVVRNSWSLPQYDLRESDAAPRVRVEGWLTRGSAEALFQRVGFELEALQAHALETDFAPVPLGATASIAVSNELAELDSYNVIGTIPGAERPAEHIVYLAHWDHLGMDPSLLPGDAIYNGAADNATGVAALLEIAEALASERGELARSVTFLAVTAEEKGLLGSRYFAEHPITEPGNVVAALNMDIMARGAAADTVTVIGLNRSELGALAAEAAARDGRSVEAHPAPESGYFYRSDHFSLAKVGIPSLLLLNPGAADSEYVREHYHQPSDEFDPAWNLEAAAQDARLFFAVGRGLAESDAFPAWSADSEFRALRETSREAALRRVR